MLAIATMEIAGGQMVAGASRLVNGIVQLALLAFGILAGVAIVGISHTELLDHRGSGLGPMWASWLGVSVFGIGVHLHFSAPLASLPWLFLVLVVAFGAQSAGGALFGRVLSSFFGALAVMPLVLWVERLPHGPPKLVTFLRAFWLLVAGATGLIGVIEIIGGWPGTPERLSVHLRCHRRRLPWSAHRGGDLLDDARGGQDDHLGGARIDPLTAGPAAHCQDPPDPFSSGESRL